MTERDSRLTLLEAEIERRLVERFAALRDEFDRLRLESDHRWSGFVGRFEQKFTGIVPPELVPEAEPEPEPALAPPSPAGLLPVEVARALDEAGSQVEMLHRFLDFCLHYASRAALFVSRSGTVSVWKAVGFSEHGGSDDEPRRATLPTGPESTLTRVLEGEPTELPKGNDVSAALSSDEMARAVLIPVVVRERVSGALYADCVASEEQQFDPEALGFLTFLAGLFVDRLAGRKLKPAPALRALEAPSAAPAEAAAGSPATAAPTAPEFELADEASPSASGSDSYGEEMMRPAETPPPPQFYGLPPEEEPRRPTAPPFPRPSREVEPAEPEVEHPLEFAPEPAEPSVPAGTIRIPTSVIEEVAAPPPPVPAPAMPVAPPPTSTPPARPSTGARRLAGPLAPVEGDERREEARRFAKLLISEIKLYNEKAVQQGRQKGNIYGLLKEDIDRSRQMYDDRIPEDVRASSNFFYEELVRILADGRADALGM
jgi:hypothetical protein